MTRLPSLALLLAVAISTTLAAPTKSTRSAIEVAIGEPHEVPVPKNANISGPVDMPLPSWMAKEGDVLRMIAPPGATSTLVVIGDLSLDIVVRENEPTGCVPNDEWAETVVPPEATVPIWDTIKELEAVQGISMSDIRVLPRAYAATYRELTHSSEDTSAVKGDTVIIVKSECGKSVNPVAEALYQAYEQVSITHGSIPSRASRRDEDENAVLSSLSETSTDDSLGEDLKLKKETTTLPSTTTTRQTRSTSVAYVSIKAMQCQQGAYCVSELEDKTFLGGDGGVNTFDLTIEHLNGKGGVHPWVVKEGKKRSIGVIPLTAGEHTFRLRGTNKKSKQPVIAPFSISVSADEPKNHQFKMTMHSLPLEPQYLRTALVKMALFLKRNPDEIKVANVSRDDVAKISVVTYWNTSLPTTSCPTKEVSQFLRGLHMKHGEEVTNDFAKTFKNEPVIHPARLEVQWLGDCEDAGAAAAAAEGGVKTAGGVAGSKGEEPTAEETDGSLTTLITVVCLLAVLLAILILIVCCVACKRSKTHKGGVNEYMSKGTPVVFPDEVDDDHADIPPNAPMLVKEERPPLRVSEHSNPLYKPPPPLAAASPRPSVGPSAHKLPPPYVPP